MIIIGTGYLLPSCRRLNFEGNTAATAEAKSVDSVAFIIAISNAVVCVNKFHFQVNFSISSPISNTAGLDVS